MSLEDTRAALVMGLLVTPSPDAEHRTYFFSPGQQPGLWVCGTRLRVPSADLQQESAELLLQQRQGESRLLA